MSRPFALAVSVVLLGGCGSHDRPPPPARHAMPAPADTHTDPAEPPPTGEGATAGEGNGVAIHGAPSPGNVEISVAVTGAEPVSLAPRIRVERRAGAAWEAVDGIASLTLRPDCAHEAAECVHLVPGAELLPPSWLGTVGDAQCICTRCAPVPAGTYRFVLTTCDGARRYLGEPFDVAAR